MDLADRSIQEEKKKKQAFASKLFSNPILSLTFSIQTCSMLMIFFLSYLLYIFKEIKVIIYLCMFLR